MAKSTPKPRTSAHPREKAPEEVVHVPRWISRWRFVLVLGLMVFVLIIFVVPQQFMDLFRPRAEAPGPHMVWNDPVRGQVEYSPAQWREEMRKLGGFWTAQGLDAREALTDSNVAYLIVADALAQNAGVAVTDQELARAILQGEPGMFRMQPFLSREIYEASLRRVRVKPADFEESLRRILRVTRYENLLLAAMVVPEPAEIERLWKERHQLHSFDLVSVSVADFGDEADAALPDEAGLAEWYAALENPRVHFADAWIPERVAAELAGYHGGEDSTPAGLLERFPRPEDTDLEALGKAYYDRFAYVRFARPMPTEPPPPGEEMFLSGAYPYEEVSEQALLEARILAATREWLEDLRARLAKGETVDLASEAAELGLVSIVEAEALAQAEWTKRHGDELASAVFTAPPSGLAPEVIVGKRGLFIARVLDRQPPSAPPLEAVREQALALWKKEKAAELAKARLGELRAKLAAAAEPTDGSEPPPGGEDGAEPTPETPEPVKASAEEFAAAATELGLESVQQDYFDPLRAADAPADSLPPAQGFLVSALRGPGYELYTMETGQVSEPLLDAAGETAWLVRKAGQREREEADIRPSEVAELEQAAVAANSGELREKVLSLEVFRERYGLRVLSGPERESAPR
jgi:hypothetical protein